MVNVSDLRKSIKKSIRKKEFRVEADVRARMREMFGRDALFWTEHAAGGTPGMPDCMLAFARTLVPIELKRAARLKNGQLKVELRPDQKRVIRRMIAQNIDCYVIAGEVGTTDLWIMRGASALNEQWFFWSKIEEASDIELFLSFDVRSFSSGNKIAED